MKFSKGDKVVFLNEIGGGIVIKYTTDRNVVIKTNDGFELPYSESELVKETQELVYKPHLINKEANTKGCPVHKTTTTDKPIEIDLHIGGLIETTNGLSNREILLKQIAYFKEKMNWAIENNVKTLVFIHGVGEGVLRHEINERLRMYENITWGKASIKEYGDGATEVTILHD